MSRGTWERKMGKRTKGNYIKGYFLRLFLLVAVLVSVMGIALLQFSKRVVGDEIIKLHQTILRSTAGETASVLGGLRESLLEIAENVQLTEWLESGVGDESEIDRLTEDEIYLNFKRGNPLRVYIYDQEKLRYSSDRREVPWEEVRGQLSPSGEEEDFWMAGPVRVQEEGLYRNSFFMIQRVRNLLEYFGQEIPENMQGHSLCGMMRSGSTPRSDSMAFTSTSRTAGTYICAARSRGKRGNSTTMSWSPPAIRGRSGRMR